MYSSGVILYCNNVLAIWSLPIPLWCDMLSLIILLAVFTSNSALPIQQMTVYVLLLIL